MKIRNRRFAVLGTMLIVIIATSLIIAIGGYALIKRTSQNTKRTQATRSSTEEPKPVAWKTYTAQTGTLHFNYPETWKIKAVPVEKNINDLSSYTHISVTSPDNTLVVGIEDGIQPRRYGPLDKGDAILASESVRLFGHDYYWTYVKRHPDTTREPYEVCAVILTQPNPDPLDAVWPVSPDIGLSDRWPHYISIGIANVHSNGGSLDNFKNSPHMSDAKRIVDSLSVN